MICSDEEASKTKVTPKETRSPKRTLSLLQPIAARFSMVEMKRINPFQIDPFSLKLGEEIVGKSFPHLFIVSFRLNLISQS